MALFNSDLVFSNCTFSLWHHTPTRYEYLLKACLLANDTLSNPIRWHGAFLFIARVQREERLVPISWPQQHPWQNSVNRKTKRKRDVARWNRHSKSKDNNTIQFERNRATTATPSAVVLCNLCYSLGASIERRLSRRAPRVLAEFPRR